MKIIKHSCTREVIEQTGTELVKTFRLYVERSESMAQSSPHSVVS
jgi:hypothetical protein